MTFKPTKSMSAAELMSRLKSDPDWVRQNEERESKRRSAEEKFRVEEEPILSDLSEVGYRVNSVWDLVNSSSSYPKAIPVLLKHLHRSYHPRIREGIARALAVREARGIAAEEILDELKHVGEEAPGLRWALANALTVVADAKMAGKIEALAKDARYKDVGEPLKLALSKLASG
jgi:hypothetical protein